MKKVMRKVSVPVCLGLSAIAMLSGCGSSGSGANGEVIVYNWGEYIDPEVVASPQEAFYADKVSLPLEESEGRVCSEFVMCYPPGIPILAPGEEITEEILDYIVYAKEKGCSMTGPEDAEIQYLNVLKEVWA